MSYQAFKDIDLDKAQTTAVLAKYVEEGGADLSGSIQQFTKPAQEASQKSKDATTEALNEEWKAILTAAGNTPADEQEKLVDFVQALRKERLQGASWDGAEVVWQDLPQFGWEVREAWNYSPKDPKATEESKIIWFNLNAFLARLTSLSQEESGNDLLNFSTFALWTLREGLEDDAPEETPGNGALRAAAICMVYAAKAIWKFSKEGLELDGKTGKAGFSYKSHDWKGFSEERWMVWKKELANASAQVSDSDVAGLLTEAGIQMGGAETS